MQDTSRYLSILVTALALAALNVRAHTVLSSSVPADNAVAAAPETITLAFSTQVRLTGLSLEDATGRTLDLGAIPTATQQEFVIVAPALPPGAYRVSWRAVGADSHVVSGEFRFEVAELLSRA
ncbi:MAG: copper resistance protein CopC [Rhodospirillaceae bacterium]|nr:copper resistance protein CopC [Rhodospirillaceae bacterium]